MNDLIDRQRAITALTFAKETGEMKCGELSSVFKVLNRLPSAEPQIIRCKDCIYSGTPDEDKWRLCHHDGAQWNEENHFCGYAERREVTT